MQPMLALTAPNPGIIHINGQFAGEVSEEAPLIRPVCSRGAVYLDYRPLDNSCRPLARKLVFSMGEILTESAEAAQNLNIILWPGGVSEVELAPDPWDISHYSFSRKGRSFILEGGAEPKLYCEGKALASLPEGAQTPEIYDLRGGAAFIGSCRDGMYLLTTDPDFRTQSGFLRAREIKIETDGSICALTPAGGAPGRALRESWQLTPSGIMLVSSDFVWENGVPRWPQTAEECVIAAVEGMRAGMAEEAENYLTPGLREQHPLEDIADSCDLCVRIKYMPPNSRPAVGLLRLEGERIARVQPLFFRAVSSGEKRWQIDEFLMT